ncbi:MAG TPA: hypothetical protein VF278_03040 [Pirellulales bacterium]
MRFIAAFRRRGATFFLLISVRFESAASRFRFLVATKGLATALA